ncbi:MAG: 30S ribosomal protein S1 [Parcubacteria group bacterium CG1_02_39_15]|uniref:30S ribosomal protein S1 n=5 Tax=Candidatus Nealsoniibacteriota TaxID=1817911 RepID=A0A2G9YSV5_9BACT|nr:MAG: 30S ribosomal protein S1 [Parcubacteria group bacterium CG1_02_39_15]PIP22316.1 MAG: 30S ribosomal protein S1 [Candidatus Nealsonbacteria bacterium CG23_combo_of_CG06-09_8_20_14_all_39_25]PIW90017.1 MAG: 30S ribosomal protein S1 [Candidatus Nealsonbacteria bacterium CG_4_8_14_3_um_filter_40_11]PIZ88465.1 MAG: 30S ribosomal protein S1 [Candidatus Nealsonbacteria bacterium CG_4_10_14_0_2_um_filter_39_15]
MKEMLDKNDLLKPLKVGEIVEGKVLGKGKSSIFLDLGQMGTGIIYGKEFSEAKDQLKNVKPGDNLFVKIIDLENEDGYIELSVSGASKELTWTKLSQMKDKEETVMIKILGANKGGLTSEVLGIPAFLPVSQLDSSHYPRVEKGDQAKILKELQKFIGQDLEVKIFDLSAREGKLILSERAKETEKIKKLLTNYKVGDVVEGEITGVTDFGAFIKFGSEGLEGLIHISELDWQLVEEPAEIVQVGDKVKVKIIDISGDKVSLSLKALKKDPWQDLEAQYKKGDQVKGIVTKFNPFGAFVQILRTGGEKSSKIQGLCHISEFGTKMKMEKTLEIGKEYDFRILSIDPKEHRMSLELLE